MPSKAPGGRSGSLSQGLDREIYQVVRKLLDDEAQYPHDAQPTPTTSSVYERIRKSNSSLSRRNKQLLEGGIERVLDVIRIDDANESPSDQEAGFANGEMDASKTGKAQKRLNYMNKSITESWAQKKSKAEVDTRGHESRGSDAATPTEPGQSRHLNGERPTKRRKPAPENDRSPPTHLSLADLGGVDTVIQQLEDLIVLPLLKPEVYLTSKIQPTRGILLHGPPGCGKTMVATAFAAELGVPFISISAPSIVSGMSGESEKALREHFDEAKKIAPCLVFIDEIDAITPKRESAQREMEKRIVAQLLTCMDDLALEKTHGRAVMVLAATNRPDSLDAALRRGGRFDKEINLGIPNEAVRGQILRALTRHMTLTENVDFETLAKSTSGFVGADLSDLVSTAGSGAIKRFLDTLKSANVEMDIDEGALPSNSQILELRRLIRNAKEHQATNDIAIAITEDDFAKALPKVQPSSKREGFTTTPDTTWSDVGALRNVRDELLTAIVEPVRSPERYRRVGITAPTGVLLWGPPGCGKTLLAKAVANESKANFISVKGPELLNKYVGESERAVRQVFVRARSSIPCVIFFDELDALVPKRDGALSESSARVVNTLLTELDGLGSRSGIYVIAATNRPDIIDPAMLRPGRLETLLFVDLPEALERVEILKTLSRHIPSIDPEAIAKVAAECEGFSGADLQSLLRHAGYCAIRRDDYISIEDLWTASRKVRPSVTDRKKYEHLRAKWGTGI